MNEVPHVKRQRSRYVNQSDYLSHKFVTVCRRQRAVTVRMGMLYSPKDHSARRCPISLQLRRG